MSKRIIPFIDGGNWHTNVNCDVCPSIDAFYEELLSDTIDTQKKIDFLDDNFLTDGYGLISVYEKNCDISLIEDKINDMKNYRNNTDDFMLRVNNVLYPESVTPITNIVAADYPVVLHSRWCRRCGARKPDIYDSLRHESTIQFKILNFHVESSAGVARILWRDSTSPKWSRAELFRNGIKILESTVNGSYESSPYEDILSGGFIYKYKVVNYGYDDKIIDSTVEKEIYVPAADDTPPGKCTGTVSKQRRTLYFVDNAWIAKDFIQTTWTPPADSDLDGVMLRVGHEYYVPGDEAEGLLGQERMLFDEYDFTSGNTYYFKPFPYDAEKIKLSADGRSYVSYRNYNRESEYSVVTVKEHVGVCSDISLIKRTNGLDIAWKDPEDESWAHTLVILKEGDEPIIDENDGDVKFISSNRNEYANSPYSIYNLKNNVKYHVALFPVSADGLINACPENQISGIPGYYRDSILFDYNRPFDFSGNFSFSKGEWSANYDTSAFFEFEDNIKYGGVVSFDLRLTGMIATGEFLVYMTLDKTMLLYKGNNSYDMKKLSFDIPPCNYVKIMFVVNNFGVPFYCVLRNVTFDFNSYEKR